MNEFIFNGTNRIWLGVDFATTGNRGIAKMSDNAGVVTGTNETDYINPKQAKDNYAQRTYANVLNFSTSDSAGTTVQAH